MIDLSEPRTIVMLGTPFHDVTTSETLDRIAQIVKRRAPAYLVSANLDCATQAADDLELQRILIEAELVLCDNSPLVWASRLTGHPLRERVAISVLAQQLASRAATEGWKIFLLGQGADSVNRARESLTAQFPGAIISGTYATPIAPLHELNHAAIVANIKTTSPDILLVAFGCPKQEKWIHSHYRKIGVPCAIGVGDSFDFLAANVNPVQKWARRIGFEWAIRLLQQPGQQVGIYAKDCRILINQVLRERKAIRSNPSAADASDASFAGNADNVEILFWRGIVTEGSLCQLSSPTYTKPFIIDMSQVSLVDSSGIGHILRTLRRAWAQGISGCLAAPSDKVLSIFSMARLDRVLPTASSMAGAHDMIKREQGGAILRPVVDVTDESMLLLLPSRIINDNAQNCATSAVTEWGKRPSLRILRLDLASTTFIDSSGLGFLIRCQRMVAERKGACMELLNIPPNVRNILKVSKLDKLLRLPD